jgi:hypothetical protein
MQRPAKELSKENTMPPPATRTSNIPVVLLLFFIVCLAFVGCCVRIKECDTPAAKTQQAENNKVTAAPEPVVKPRPTNATTIPMVAVVIRASKSKQFKEPKAYVVVYLDVDFGPDTSLTALISNFAAWWSALEKELKLAADVKEDLALIADLHSVASNPNNTLAARALAVDLLGRISSKNQQVILLQKSKLLNLINDTNLGKLKDEDDMIVFVTHVVQALGRMGLVARDALPRIVLARGYEANLTSAVDTAAEAIQKSK